MTYRNIDAATLQGLLGEREPPVLLDVRSTEEVARGTIAGALHIPLAELPRRYPELSADQPLVVYCLSGARSASACRFLAERGFTALYHLEGGVAGWLRAGHPLGGI